MSKKTKTQPPPSFIRFNRIFFCFIIITLFSFVVLHFLRETKPEDNLICSQKKSDQHLFLGPANKFSLESPDFLLVQKNTLKASLPPTTFSSKVLGVLVGSESSLPARQGIIEYSVEPGDNLWSISKEFDISLESLLWANELSQSSVIQPGQKLIIPPVSGIIYHVKKGDTISGIAETYKGKIADIIAFNDLSSDGDIYIGDILVVPNGEIPPPTVSYAPTYVPLASSYFICPISPPCRVTQGLHWYNAIDFSHGNCEEPIYAAAGGTVLRVRLTNSTSRWAYGGAGNHITILHPNGVVTMYGHIAKSLVTPGQKVSQGDIIALMGGQPGTPGAGMSTGCHLHFGVRGARNPFAQ